MLILSVMLMACVPQRSAHSGSFSRARWMMASGTGLISLQFLLQYVFGFRQMGVTQAVLLNLLFFTPASLLCSMAILYVQRQGHISRKEWMISGTICVVSMLILLATAWFDGVPIEQESTTLRGVEYVSSLLYILIQSYIFAKQYKAYIRLERAVDEYYDRERHDLFGWMGLSMKTMALLAFFVPVVIFMEGFPLVMFSIAYFLCISYSTISLYSYGISKNIERVEAADVEDFYDDIIMPQHSHDAISEAIESWKLSGAYRQRNLTLSTVAQQMDIPQKELQEWLHLSEHKKLSGLVTTLRIAEAQRLLKEHADWSVEDVADYCGFNDRKYFHEVFRQQTGVTAQKYQQLMRGAIAP